MTTMAYLWLAAALVLAVLEAMTTNLVSIWFVGGAIAAFLTALFDGSLLAQLIVFTVVTAALLAAMRPLLRKHMIVKNPIRTNASRIIGMEAIVTEPIDNLRSSGAVRVDGVEWTARSQSGAAIDAGTRVKILRIEGVKVFVQPVEETAPAASGVS